MRQLAGPAMLFAASVSALGGGEPYCFSRLWFAGSGPDVVAGDLKGDGTIDIAVAAQGDDDGGLDTGAVWILFMRPDGTVAGQQKISDSQGGFGGDLSTDDQFGATLAAIGDLDGDGVSELDVGANHDDDGGTQAGAVWVLFLDHAEPCSEADIAPPIGELDFTDAVYFLGAFGASLPEADLIDSFGVRDFSDVVTYLCAVGTGCP